VAVISGGASIGISGRRRLSDIISDDISILIISGYKPVSGTITKNGNPIAFVSHSDTGAAGLSGSPIEPGGSLTLETSCANRLSPFEMDIVGIAGDGFLFTAVTV
jgi:hypothetical protein